MAQNFLLSSPTSTKINTIAAASKFKLRMYHLLASYILVRNIHCVQMLYAVETKAYLKVHCAYCPQCFDIHGWWGARKSIQLVKN